MVLFASLSSLSSQMAKLISKSSIPPPCEWLLISWACVLHAAAADEPLCRIFRRHKNRFPCSLLRASQHMLGTKLWIQQIFVRTNKRPSLSCHSSYISNEHVCSPSFDTCSMWICGTNKCLKQNPFPSFMQNSSRHCPETGFRIILSWFESLFNLLTEWNHRQVA